MTCGGEGLLLLLLPLLLLEAVRTSDAKLSGAGEAVLWNALAVEVAEAEAVADLDERNDSLATFPGRVARRAPRSQRPSSGERPRDSCRCSESRARAKV